MQAGDEVLIKTNRLAEPWRIGFVTEVAFDVVANDHYVKLDDGAVIYEREAEFVSYLRR